MVRQQLRLGLGNFRKPACENLRDAFVQLAPSCVQDRLKGRVADQRMLEDVARLRWRAPLSQQIASDKLLKSFQQRRLRHLSYGIEQFVGKLSTDYRCCERDIFGHAKAVQTRNQRILQRRWNCEVPI